MIYAWDSQITAYRNDPALRVSEASKTSSSKIKIKFADKSQRRNGSLKDFGRDTANI
jgi:hypothetical protein